jgi:hypothetical protein
VKDSRPHTIRVQFGGTSILLGTGGGAINPINCSAGGYQYYYTDALTSINGSNWTQNGTLSATPAGLTSAATSGGSLISKVAVPDGTADYEVSATLNLQQTGGTYSLFMRATTDAQSGPAARGTYYVADLQYPIVNGASCTATLAVYKTINGVVTSLANTTVVCAQTTTIRMTRNSAARIEVFVNRLLYTLVYANEITTGMAGVGVRAAPAANTISLVQLGPQDRVSPSPVDGSSIAVSALPNRVDMQWQGAADDPNGTGIATYQVYRADVGFLGQSNLPHFTDTTVAPGTNYTYTIYDMDYAWNNAGQSFTLTTPPAGTLDARRVGVRPTGSYWGGLGENIDALSGNLNFTLPLLKAQGRAGMSLPINLSYNSEHWRKDAGTWNLGTDVGYGYGWKLLAGSITPYYAPGFIYIDHYLFTDLSGAEYRLSQTSSGWASSEGIYVTYDPVTRRLRFNDGTFWVMGCTSAGTEEDAGTMYPTVVQDSNGNQILIRYQPGRGVTWRDSSARIWQIEDVRARPGVADPSTYWTYDFEYDTGPGLPHLLQITNNIGTSEGYTVTTTGLRSLLSPFDGANLDSTYFLQNITVAGLGLTYQFRTNDSGQLTRVTFPYGGYLQWDYANFQYANQRYQTEVSRRYLSKDGQSQTTYVILRNAADNTRQLHWYFDLYDPDQ